MRIIKPGELPQWKSWLGECDYCGCEVEVTAADVLYACRDQDGDPIYEVHCPTKGCGHQIRLHAVVEK